MLGLRRAGFALALILAVASETSGFDIKFGTPFGDHMVIQRDRPIRVWGEARADSTVDLQFGPRRATAKAGRDGAWTATLDALPAGGPLVLLATSGADRVEVTDVLVGDVWICSGQSNMQMTLKECDGGPAAAESSAKLANLRLGSVGRKSSTTPETRTDLRWKAASRETSGDFSGVGFFFAAELLADPALKDVPIGVIDSSFGGSRCEAWVPKEFLSGFAPGDLRDSMFGAGPSGFYNAMIAPLGRAPIKGVVWYQGEGNADRPDTYPKLLTALIRSWRDRFETPELPFIVIQLPDWAPGSGGLSWAWLREAQAEAVRANPHTSLAVGINTTDGFDLHPKQKSEIGKRAALLALRDVYGREIVASGPAFKKAEPQGHQIRVTFDTAQSGLASQGGGPLRGFAIAGADGKYRYAQASIDGDSVVLTNEDVRDPVSVRYAWAGVPDATLINKHGLPAAPFRTDASSPATDVDVQKQPMTRHIQMKSYEATIGGNGSVTSLGVGGKQFLSNEFGLAGGTTVPGWFGPRSLADVRDLGPGRVSCSDNDITLLMEFTENGMEWQVTNRGKDEIRFRIALAPKVVVDRKDGSGPRKLARGAATLIINGVEAVTESEDGPILETAIGGHKSKRLVLTIGEKSPSSR